MKPKYKPGDKVKVTLELEIKEVVTIPGGENYYEFIGQTLGYRWFPDCEPFDKIAKLVKKPARKKVKR